MITEIRSGLESVYAQRNEQAGKISHTIENILGELEVEATLSRIQAEWGEGKLVDVGFEHSGFPDSKYNLGNPTLRQMRVGTSLETEVPVIVGTYDREYLGEGYYEPVECMPGHSHSDGRYSIYGNNWSLDRVEIKDNPTTLDVFVRPVWKEYRQYQDGALQEPERYLVTVGNILLPSNRESLTVEEILHMQKQDGELLRHFGYKGVVSRAEIEFGIQNGINIVEIDAISPILKRRFDDVVEMIAEERRSQNGNPKDFREKTRKLVESLPKGFQERGNATSYQLI